jgi:hypothetical protein
MITEESGSVCEVAIVLQRIYLYHLTNTYLPTFSLLVIVDITLYFDESETQLAIGFSLTIMLVIYTLFQGVSALFPKTAYLKFIDFWLIFCLLVPFVVFVTEVVWQWQFSKRGMENSNKSNSWFLRTTRLTSRKFVQVSISPTHFISSFYIQNAKVIQTTYLYYQFRFAYLSEKLALKCW